MGAAHANESTSACVAGVVDSSGTAFLVKTAGTYANQGTVAERLRIRNDGIIQIGNTENPTNYNVKDIMLGNHSGNHGITILSGTSNGGYIMFSDNNGGGSNAYRGQIEYQHNGDYMRFLTATFERLRIDSSGNVLIGTTTATSEFTVRGAGTVAAFEGTGGSGSIMIKDVDDGTLAYALVDGGNFDIQTSGSSYSTKLRVTSAGNVGVLHTNPRGQFVVASTKNALTNANCNDPHHFHLSLKTENDTNATAIGLCFSHSSTVDRVGAAIIHNRQSAGSVGDMRFYTCGTEGTTTEQFRIDASGNVTTCANTSFNRSTPGHTMRKGDAFNATRSGGTPLEVNRESNDGALVNWFQANSHQGSVTLSGSSVNYGGGVLSRWSQLVGISTNVKSDRPTIYQGTVMSNLDEMCEWVGEENMQLNKTQVSTASGDKKVAGVFWAWDDDDDVYTNDFYVAQTGDFIVRVAGSVTVENGDLLESAGNGTAKPQSDDIVRSKTVGKISSGIAYTTYADGSKAYPCVLMAC